MSKRRGVKFLDGQRVRVYRNLHKGCFSVQTYETGRGWRVRAHTTRIRLDDVEFKVMETGRQKVLKERKKNVHAFVIGTVRMEQPRYHQNVGVKYNPYVFSSFVQLFCETPVHKAQRAYLAIRSNGFTYMKIEPVKEELANEVRG